MGGPVSAYYDGWFSETEIPMFLPFNKLENITLKRTVGDIKPINDVVIKYIKEEFPKIIYILKGQSEQFAFMKQKGFN